MNQARRTIVSVVRLRTEAVSTGRTAPIPFVYVDATMSDGSRAVLFSARVDETAFVDGDLIGLTAQEAYEFAQERDAVL